MLGNVLLSPALFRIGVYFVSRKNSDFFEIFFAKYVLIGKIMKPATSNGRRFRWVLGWFLFFNVLKDFKAIWVGVRIPLFRAMRVPISSPARASSVPSYRAWQDPCLPSRPCRLRRCTSRCSTVRCPRGCRTE